MTKKKTLDKWKPECLYEEVPWGVYCRKRKLPCEYHRGTDRVYIDCLDYRKPKELPKSRRGK